MGQEATHHSKRFAPLGFYSLLELLPENPDIHRPNWGPLTGLTKWIERPEESQIVNVVRTHAEAQYSTNVGYAVVGISGAGKTMLVRKIAYNLVDVITKRSQYTFYQINKEMPEDQDSTKVGFNHLAQAVIQNHFQVFWVFCRK